VYRIICAFIFMLAPLSIIAAEAGVAGLPEGATPFEENKEIILDGVKTVVGKASGYRLTIGDKTVLVGPWKATSANGTPSISGFYDNVGRKTGSWTQYQEEGKPFIVGSFVDGVAHGPVISYHKNGNLAGILWNEKGKQDGISVTLSPEGKIIAVEKRKDGKATETLKVAEQ